MDIRKPITEYLNAKMAKWGNRNIQARFFWGCIFVHFYLSDFIYFVVFALRYVPVTNILVGLVFDEAMVSVMSAESDSKYIMIPMYGAAKINDHINHNKITIQVFIGVRLIQPFSSVTFLQGNTPIIWYNFSKGQKSWRMKKCLGAMVVFKWLT